MNGTPRTTKAQRRAWLLAHAELWRGQDRTRLDFYRQIAAKMKAAGLYAPSTLVGDICIEHLLDPILEAESAERRQVVYTPQQIHAAQAVAPRPEAEPGVVEFPDSGKVGGTDA